MNHLFLMLKINSVMNYFNIIRFLHFEFPAHLERIQEVVKHFLHILRIFIQVNLNS